MRGAGALVVLAVLLVAAAGCVPPSLVTLRGGLDSLRTVVDTLVVRDSIAFEVLSATQRDVAANRELLLSARASYGSTSQDLLEQMTRLQVRLDDVMARFSKGSSRSSDPPPASSGGDVQTLYDQANQDLTQGRYALALRGFREYVSRAPQSAMAENAQYGVAECFFAQSRFDSAAVEYARVPVLYPEGQRVTASMYKLGLSQDKLGRKDDARKTFEDLVRRFPNSGEAQLARERLGQPKR
jgi:tol-pal system protein YbgF